MASYWADCADGKAVDGFLYSDGSNPFGEEEILVVYECRVPAGKKKFL